MDMGSLTMDFVGAAEYECSRVVNCSIIIDTKAPSVNDDELGSQYRNKMD